MRRAAQLVPVVLFSSVLGAGCVARTAYVETAPVYDVEYGTVYVSSPPPAPIAEYRAPWPGPGYDWISGYWDWTGYDWGWVNGYWAPVRAGYAFVAPQYRFYGGRWVYERGYWSGARGAREYQRAPAYGWRGNAPPPPPSAAAPPA